MRVAYVGDIINNGKSLPTIGTSIVLLLSFMDEVQSVEVYCPSAKNTAEEFTFPEKVTVHESYRYDDARSILTLLNVKWKEYDTVIFNMLPTGFGHGSIANAAALLIPLFLRYIWKLDNIRVIYHNSVYTNDIKFLGYNTLFDRIRALILGMVERQLFKSVETFVLLQLYKDRIDSAIGKNRVKVMNGKYLEAITTLHMNNALNSNITRSYQNHKPMILMHGSWGPQKNLKLALKALERLRKIGFDFSVIVSGGINHHFPDYEKMFMETMANYSEVVDSYLGRVKEKDIMNLFLNADIVLLPYNTPGGHSGVLEQAMFFEAYTVALDFPEFREQSSCSSKVYLVSKEKFFDSLLSLLKMSAPDVPLNIRNKVLQTVKNVSRLLFNQ